VRETRADTTQAFIYAIALHVLLFLLAFMGLWWTRTTAPVSAAGPVVEAELIDPDALSARMKRVLRQRPKPVPPEPVQPPPPAKEEAAPPPQPIPEPRPQDSPVPQQNQAQEQIPIPDTREQERVDREAIAAEQREKEQEEKRRQEQIDLTERQRQQEAEEKQRLAEQQKEEELKKIRAEIDRAKREEDLARQKLKQLADRRAQQASAFADAAPSASPPPGNEGVDANLLAQYQAAIQRAVESNWNRPENIPPGQPCRLSIIQLPGGEVMRATVDPSCPYDDQGKRSVEAAVLKAQPLPYAGFESVFRRQLNFTFRPPD
jgi:colicin import membrane protein